MNEIHCQTSLQETRSEGVVGLDCYLYYARQLGWFNVLLCLMMFIAFVVLTFLMDYFVALWMRDSFSLKNQSYYPIFYLIMVIALIILLTTRSAFVAKIFSNGNYKILNQLVRNILRRKMAFFDTTPVGQILTRFNEDAYNADYLIPYSLPLCLTPIFMLVGICIFIVVISPLQLVLVAIIFVLMMRSFKKFTTVSIEFQRMVMLASAPVCSSIAEIMKGAPSLRVYGKLEYLEDLVRKRCDANTAAVLHESMFFQWVSDSIHILTTFLVLVTVWFLTFGKIFR